MGFFSKLKKKARGQIAPVMPMAPQPLPRVPVMPQKRRGLSGLFRKLQQQIKNQQLPISNSPSFNPTIFGQPIRKDMDFSQMPQISPEDMINLQIPTEMPVMPKERMAPPVMNQMQGEPRMMMAGGRDANMVDFLNSDPQQQIFGIETKIGILENQLQEALANNDRQAYDMIVQQINDADAQKINIKNSINPLRTSGRPEMVGPRFDGFEEFITSIGPENYGDYVGEPTLDDILTDPRVRRMIESGIGRGRPVSNRESLDDILSDLEKKN